MGDGMESVWRVCGRCAGVCVGVCGGMCVGACVEGVYVKCVCGGGVCGECVEDVCVCGGGGGSVTWVGQTASGRFCLHPPGTDKWLHVTPPRQVLG